MTTYKTFDVLEVQPNRADDPERMFRRRLTRLDPGMGKVSVMERAGTPTCELDFEWFLDGRGEIGTFKDFLVARRGRAVPFWVPSWRHDIVMAMDATSTDANVIMQETGYTKHQFSKASRRQLAFILSDGSMVLRAVTGSTAPGNGTEVLTLDSAVGVSIPAATTMVAFLHLVRLQSDVVEVKWHHQTLAEASLRFVEVPREIP